MTSIPLKPQYGPTLGRLLEPRWRSAPPTVRALAIAAGVGLATLMIAFVLSLLNASYSHGGAVPFSFEYRSLYKTAPNPGGFVKVARSSGGKLEDSYAVAPLTIGSYGGSVTGELPLAAAAYTRTLADPLPRLQARRRGQDPHQLDAGWLSGALQRARRRTKALRTRRDLDPAAPRRKRGGSRRDAQQRTGKRLKAGGKLGSARNAAEDVRVRLAGETRPKSAPVKPERGLVWAIPRRRLWTACPAAVCVTG